MSSLDPRDGELHHCDGSHRWSGGPADPVDQEVYQQRLRSHLEAHRAEGYAPLRPERSGAGTAGRAVA